jgi:hypothetical protein
VRAIIPVVALASVFGVLSATAYENNYNQIGEQKARGKAVAVEAISPKAVTPGKCGPIDLVLLVDTTGSMGGAINSVRDGLSAIIDTAKTASAGDLRLGLITFKDTVTVNSALTTDTSSVQAAVNLLTANGGSGAAEASDEAKNTAVNNLPGGIRNDSAGFPGTQIGDFTTPYRSGAKKLAVLITDAPPAGFNDFQDPADNAAMHTHAVTARSKGIVVSDVFVPTGGDYAGQAALLKDDATTSGGIFVTVASDGSGTGAAINDIVGSCETFPGPGPLPGESIPTLSEWAMICLALLLALFGAARIRRTGLV